MSDADDALFYEETVTMEAPDGTEGTTSGAVRPGGHLSDDLEALA
ncbi:hypothetical protein [Streptomyces sp. TR02-1]